MNRRNFFQKALLAVSAISVFSSLAKAEERRRGGAANAGAGAAVLVDPNDPQAKAVNYKHDLNEIKDKALQTDRMGVKFKDQKCSGCIFYMKDKETNVAGKKAAPCQMPFAAGKVVAEKGWCSSWAKKA